MSCVETTEPINLSFGFVDLDGPKQAQVQSYSQGGAIVQFQSYLPRGANVHDILPRTVHKKAEPIDLPFGLWTRMGGRKHKFSYIRQVAPMSPQWQDTLAPPGEYD